MRILHVSWEFPPVMYGGLGRHVVALATEEAALGHEVVVLTQHGEGAGADELPDDEVVGGVRVVRVREGGAGQERTIANLLPWVDAMQGAMTPRGADLVRQWRPDVVHGHDWVVGDTSAAIAAACDAPLLVTIHATEAGRHGGWIVGPLSHEVHAREWRLANGADRLIVCSEAMREEVTAAFAPAAPVSVVPNGVSVEEWSASEGERAAARAALGMAPDDPLVVYSGRLVWEKGLQTVIDAMPVLLARFPRLRLSVAGRGPLEPDLREQAGTLGVSGSVDFRGFLPEAELRPLVAAADAVVVPSMYEPFGLVAVEAGALGAPVVASDVGGLREIVVDGETGLLVPRASPEALALAVTRLVADPARARAMADAARARVAAHYAWPVIAASTVGVAGSARRAERASRAQPPTPDMNVLTGEVVTR